MKQFVTVLILFVFTTSAFAAGGKYQAKMEQTLQEMAAGKTLEDLQAVANTFQLIGQNETKEWLPRYYEARCYILMSFRGHDQDVRDAQLDKADVLINAALEIAPEESELYALQGLMHTARLVINPMLRGRKYSMLSNASLNKSLEMDANNPRAQYMIISNEKGKAEFFGKDVSEYCAKATELIEQWDVFVAPSDLHPTWGKTETESIAGECD